MRWLRGSASDLIFAPWLNAIEKNGGSVLGGKRVSTIRFKDDEASAGAPGATGAALPRVAETIVEIVEDALSDGEKEKSPETARESHRGQEGADAGGDKRSDGNDIVGGDDGAGFVRVETTDGDVFRPDAVILAVGITAAKALVRSSPEMASQPELQALSNLRGVDVVAIRLFFKKRLDMPRAASVAGGGMAPG